MRRPELLVATVGTSLWRHLEDFAAGLQKKPVEEWVKEAALAFKGKNPERVAAIFSSVPGVRSEFGGEIASITSTLREPPFQQVREVALLCSDTEEGQFCARVVARYLENWHERKLNVVTIIVEGLQAKDESEFRVKGLRSLVRELARLYRSSEGKMAVDVTGGFKAEIAVAVVFGMAFGVTVFYRFEQFRGAVEIPPMPVSVDLDFVKRHINLLSKTSIPVGVLRNHFGSLDEENREFARFRVLLKEPHESMGTVVYPVSELAQVLLELYKTQKGH